MNTHGDESACSICGAEFERDTSPELDSTHLCPECAAMQRAAGRSPHFTRLHSVDDDLRSSAG